MADVSQCVRQRADALMLSSESAMGRFPGKALGVLRRALASSRSFMRERERER